MQNNALLKQLDAPSRERLEKITPMQVSAGDVLFRAGEQAKGYPIVLSGTVDVSLMGASGREIVLYSVNAGQTCIQSTMGLMGVTPYGAEGRASTNAELIFVPKTVFSDLMAQSVKFRELVFTAFGDRLNSVMHLLEKVAFQKVENRIASELLVLADRVGKTTIPVTQTELASRVGTAREVVSRKLEIWAKQGIITRSRGMIEIHNLTDLENIAAERD